MAAHIIFGCIETSKYLRNKLEVGSKRKYLVHHIKARREEFGKYHHLPYDLRVEAKRFRS